MRRVKKSVGQFVFIRKMRKHCFVTIAANTNAPVEVFPPIRSLVNAKLEIRRHVPATPINAATTYT